MYVRAQREYVYKVPRTVKAFARSGMKVRSGNVVPRSNATRENVVPKSTSEAAMATAKVVTAEATPTQSNTADDVVLLDDPPTELVPDHPVGATEITEDIADMGSSCTTKKFKQSTIFGQRGVISLKANQPAAGGQWRN